MKRVGVLTRRLSRILAYLVELEVTRKMMGTAPLERFGSSQSLVVACARAHSDRALW